MPHARTTPSSPFVYILINNPTIKQRKPKLFGGWTARYKLING